MGGFLSSAVNATFVGILDVLRSVLYTIIGPWSTPQMIFDTGTKAAPLGTNQQVYDITSSAGWKVIGQLEHLFWVAAWIAVVIMVLLSIYRFLIVGSVSPNKRGTFTEMGYLWVIGVILLGGYSLWVNAILTLNIDIVHGLAAWVTSSGGSLDVTNLCSGAAGCVNKTGGSGIGVPLVELAMLGILTAVTIYFIMRTWILMALMVVGPVVGGAFMFSPSTAKIAVNFWKEFILTVLTQSFAALYLAAVLVIAKSDAGAGDLGIQTTFLVFVAMMGVMPWVNLLRALFNAVFSGRDTESAAFMGTGMLAGAAAVLMGGARAATGHGSAAVSSLRPSAGGGPGGGGLPASAVLGDSPASNLGATALSAPALAASGSPMGTHGKAPMIEYGHAASPIDRARQIGGAVVGTAFGIGTAALLGGMTGDFRGGFQAGHRVGSGLGAGLAGTGAAAHHGAGALAEAWRNTGQASGAGALGGESAGGAVAAGGLALAASLGTAPAEAGAGPAAPYEGAAPGAGVASGAFGPVQAGPASALSGGSEAAAFGEAAALSGVAKAVPGPAAGLDGSSGGPGGSSGPSGGPAGAGAGLSGLRDRLADSRVARMPQAFQEATLRRMGMDPARMTGSERRQQAHAAVGRLVGYAAGGHAGERVGNVVGAGVGRAITGQWRRPGPGEMPQMSRGLTDRGKAELGRLSQQAVELQEWDRQNKIGAADLGPRPQEPTILQQSTRTGTRFVSSNGVELAMRDHQPDPSIPQGHTATHVWRVMPNNSGQNASMWLTEGMETPMYLAYGGERAQVSPSVNLPAHFGHSFWHEE